VIDWYCIYKNNEKTLDHLLLHCDVVRDLRNMVFQMFGVEWVMPRLVVDLMACWKISVGRNDINIVWNAIPSFLSGSFGEKGTLATSMIMRRRAWIYKFCFLNSYLSGSFITSSFMSLALQTFLLFFLVLDLLGVFLLYTFYVLGMCLNTFNELLLLIYKKNYVHITYLGCLLGTKFDGVKCYRVNVVETFCVYEVKNTGYKIKLA
jgi:hypothetical protein